MKCDQHDYLMPDKPCTCPPEAVEANVSDFPGLPKAIPKSIEEQRKLAGYAAAALMQAFSWENSGNGAIYKKVFMALMSFAESGNHTKIS
jgi:hypothetical protein